MEKTVRVSFNAHIQKGHRIKVPARLLFRHQIRAGDILHVEVEYVDFDVRLGKEFRFTIPKPEYEAIPDYLLRKPVVKVTLEFEERPETKLTGEVMGTDFRPISQREEESSSADP